MSLQQNEIENTPVQTEGQTLEESLDGQLHLLDAPTDETGYLVANKGTNALSPVPIREGGEVSATATQQTSPGGSVVYYASGPAGAKVTVTLKRVANSGGHAHGGETSDPAAVGTVSPGQFVLGDNYPQNVPVTHQVTDVCGAITVTANFPSQSISARTEVSISGLVPLQGNANLLFKAPTAAHPSPYYGTPQLANALVTLANAYAARTNKPITVTDANLPTGGRFDLNLDWQPPHSEHMKGRQVDIRKRDMSANEQQIFKDEAARAGFSVLNEADHWHLRI